MMITAIKRSMKSIASSTDDRLLIDQNAAANGRRDRPRSRRCARYRDAIARL
jgi:hypothetical protein